MIRLAELDKSWQDEIAKLESTKSRLIALGEAKRNASKIEAEFVAISSSVPYDPRLPSLIVEFQNMADDAGVELLSIRPSEEIPQGEFNKIEVSLAATGNYTSVIDFLSRIEKAKRSLKINTLSVNVQSYPNLILNLAIDAFSMVGDGQTSQSLPVQSAANN